MKILIFIALIFTTAVSLQGQVVNKQYDKFEDRTRYWTSPVKVRDGYEHELRVSGYFYYRGRGAGKPIESIGLVFFSKSPQWKYLKDATLTVIVDGDRLPLGQPVRRDSDIPNATSQYDDARLSESLTFKIRYSTFRRIADGKSVEMRLGSTEFQLAADILDALRSLLTKVKRV
jgi:hypothetical protein